MARLGGSILAAMSYDLLFWKAPVVRDEDKARALTHRFLEDQTGPFEASDDVLRFYDDVLARYPALESYSMDQLRASPPVSHWSDTPERSDRLVVMSFSWTVMAKPPAALISDSILPRTAASAESMGST